MMPPSPPATLQIENLEVNRGGSRILRGVNFEVPPGQVVCLMGRNGVGKTTTLRTIVGLLRPAAGNLYFNGASLLSARSDQRARAGIAYVPQGREIFPHLSVWENLQISLVVSKKNNGKANSQLDRAFTLFPVLKEMLERKGGVLSGGQQQQLAIARALLTGPKLLLLDEPTEGIQPSIIDQIGEAIQKLKAEGEMSILLVEQYLDFARELADRFCIMDRGAIVASGAIGELSEEIVREHLVV